MTQFDDRERAEELRFAMDSELLFKINARRDKYVGIWAADLLGLTGEEKDLYAASIVVADLEEIGDEDVIRKLTKDFAAKNVEVSDHAIRKELEKQFEIAREELMK